MTFPILDILPVRTCNKVYATYGSFKPYLRQDFNKRCGYCDCDDHHLGGSRGFQIDHFKPKKQFPEHLTDYSNLVYSCPYCNRAKWDRWQDHKGFIDPCDQEYAKHLHRESDGKISYNSTQGKYIFINLNLGLDRHSIIWMLRMLELQLKEIDILIENNEGEEEIQLLRKYREIAKKIQKYTDSHRVII